MALEINHVYIGAWVALVAGLSLSTFGLLWSSLFILYALLFILGFFLVLGYWGYTQSTERMALTEHAHLLSSRPGLQTILEKVWESNKTSYKMDKRLTGSSIIDEPLQEVLQFFFRDFVHGWYYQISTDEGFLYDLRHTLQRALIAFANRSKDVEWVSFLTTRFVDDITNHLKIFRKARQRLEKLQKDGEETVDIENLFFQIEAEMENDICRDKICLADKREKEYLCDISEMLLYLLLPPEDFHNKPFRYFFREVIATCVLLPTAQLVCDPDYINQTVVWLCKESTFTKDAFLTIISEGLSSGDDVQAVKNKVDVEIAKLRAHDSETSGAADVAVRQQLSSLLFVKKLCHAKEHHLEYEDLVSDNPEGPDKLFVPSQPVPVLPLHILLQDNIALSYFIEFMNSMNGQVYLYFWLAVESFRVTAEQQLSVSMERQLSQDSSSSLRKLPIAADLGDLRTAAKSIFDQYLSEQADAKVDLPKDMVKKTWKKVSQEEPCPDCFDEAQKWVFEILGQDQFYTSFLNSQTYMRCLIELDVLKERSEDGDVDTASIVDDDLDICSVSSSDRIFPDEPVLGEKLWSSDDDLRLTASINQIGLCKDNGKTYAVYAISVFRATQEGTNSWTIYRRYSDFDDLHMHLKNKFGPLPNLLLPGKRTFRNMDKDFLEKRRAALDSYIQTLLSTDFLDKYPGMFEVVANFLEHGKYAREKGQFARKVDNMKHSVHNVSHAIKTVPLGLSGGMQKIFTNKQTGRQGLKDDAAEFSAEIDFEDDDNIALRVLLLLMDEIFDLKDRNLWLRRRIIVLLRQIIKTTYGDRINRKIVESVNWMTSAEQIAEYVKMFRESFWPGGVLAESAPERASDIKLRTRVAAKTKMYGSIPDDLKRFLGTEVTLDGICRVFDTFQYTSLNKRLMYLLCEGMLEQLFPDNKFSEIFRKIHAKST
ncbi:sorting nexin-13 isoform X2 [Nematostella vectensis]|uniref:sorting nexin-13 isoform X2 n=1 Tax=Nematostella vectensis TaxID=45351 RepID=UPI00207719B1|nr:sorting nexin-13 isoform X2 [Nematostella vectensis]